MNIKITYKDEIDYIFNISRITISKVEEPVDTINHLPSRSDEMTIREKVYIFAPAYPEGYIISEENMVNNVKRRLSERDSEFLIVES